VTPRIVLASASPRRRELLAALGVGFEVAPAGVDETVDGGEPLALAKLLAARKARAVAAMHPDAMVIGSDTVVALHGRLLEKPVDADEAREMLRALRAGDHIVATGVAVVGNDGEHVAAASARVTMRDYSDAEMEAFIETGSPFDKAGGYAIQDPDFAPVAGLDGCECAVIGLPLWTLRRLLAAAGVQVEEPALDRCQSCPERRT
jgi:septum formation protein